MKTKGSTVLICLVGAALFQALTNGAQPVTRIAGGSFHSLLLKSDGSLWAMGGNATGQLGDGTYDNTNRPERIVASNVTAIAAGDAHSLFLKSDGSLWATGQDGYGQLGDGIYGATTSFGTNHPEQIVASGVTAIAAGGQHSLFLKDDGSLWAMGHNYYGQLGDGTFSANAPYGTNRPEQIVASNVTAIAAGDYHSLFLRSDGSLWVMGDNESGQLGDGRFNTNFPYGTNQPEQIVANGVIAIAAGYRHSLFLKSDGSLWAMGDNYYGQLGDGTFSTNAPFGTNRPEQIVASNVTAIAAGDYHSLFLRSDGSLWVMGANNLGPLGDGTYNFANRPKQIVAGGVMGIAGAGDHSLFIKSDGSLWAMGGNYDGQLGDGAFSNGVNIPEQIVAGPPGYNRISIQLMSAGSVRLSYLGLAGTNYALDRSFNLRPANWVPLATNTAESGGVLVLTNTPDSTTNSFWRIRSVP